MKFWSNHTWRTLRKTSRWRSTKKSLSYTKFYIRGKYWKGRYILAHFWGQLHLAFKLQNISIGNFKTSWSSCFFYKLFLQIIMEYESGKAIPNNALLAKMERALGKLLIHSFTHSFTHSFIHAFIHAFVHSLIPSFIHPFVHSCIRSIIHSIIHSWIHLFIHWLKHSCIHSFRSVWINPSIIFHLFIHSSIHSCIHLCISIFLRVIT